MRRRPATILLAATLLAVASCGGEVPVAPAAAAQAPEAPAPAAGGVAIAMRLVAREITLEPAALTAPAGVTLHVELENRDPGIPHGLVLLAGPGLGLALVESEIVAGPASTSIEVPGLVPGSYRFSCPVHPNMAADLTVAGS